MSPEPPLESVFEGGSGNRRRPGGRSKRTGAGRSTGRAGDRENKPMFASARVFLSGMTALHGMPRPVAIGRRRPLARAAVLALVAMLLSPPGAADTRVDIGSQVRLEKISMSASPAGGTARLRVLIVNEGVTGLHLRGVVTGVSERSEIVAELQPGKTVRLDLLAIPANETLDLTTFHQRIVLHGIKSRLVPGVEIPVRFDFMEGEVAGTAHVH